MAGRKRTGTEAGNNGSIQLKSMWALCRTVTGWNEDLSPTDTRKLAKLSVFKKSFSTCPWSKSEETCRNSSEQMLSEREKSMSYLNTHNCYSALSYNGSAIAGITWKPKMQRWAPTFFSSLPSSLRLRGSLAFSCAANPPAWWLQRCTKAAPNP